MFRIWLLTIMLGAAALPAAMDAGIEERIYSMPVAEMEAVTASWLLKNGFELSHSRSGGPEIMIEAQAPGSHWSIRLNAHSALATRVQVRSIHGSKDPQLRLLWQHLADYINLASKSDEGTVPTPTAVDAARQAVACIYADNDGKPLQLSGFGIDRPGMIVSTAHDLRVGQRVSVQLSDSRRVPGQVVALDTHLDLCLVRIPISLPYVIALGHGRPIPGQEDTLFVLGCPSAGKGPPGHATLDGPPRRVSGLPLWQVRMAIEPGSSGSPVLDEQGRLAAVVKGRYRGSNTIGFLIPLETLRHFLEKH